MTTTAIRITAAARILADLVDEGIAAGLPEPYGISSLNYTEPDISFSDFAEVDAWAARLGVTAETTTSDHDDYVVEFHEAKAVVDGIAVRITSNRRVAR